MSAADAAAWARGSKIDHVLYHATNSGDAIRAGGFQISPQGGAFGDGVYFGNTAGETEGYGTEVLRVRVKAEKVLTLNGNADWAPVRDAAAAYATERQAAFQKQYAAVQAEHGQAAANEYLMREGPKHMGRTAASWQREYMQRQGYDAVDYRRTSGDDHHSQVLVFEPRNIVVIT